MIDGSSTRLPPFDTHISDPDFNSLSSRTYLKMSNRCFAIQIRNLDQEEIPNGTFTHTEVCVVNPERVPIDGRAKSRSMGATITLERSTLNGMLRLSTVRLAIDDAVYND